MADQPPAPTQPAAAGERDITTTFASAQERVKTLTTKPGPIQLLRLYSLYKQATLGDAAGDRPGLTDFTARAKYDAWAMLRGTPPEVAMTAYVRTVDELLAAEA